MSHKREVVAVVLAITFSILQSPKQSLVVRCNFVYWKKKWLDIKVEGKGAKIVLCMHAILFLNYIYLPIQATFWFGFASFLIIQLPFCFCAPQSLSTLRVTSWCRFS